MKTFIKLIASTLLLTVGVTASRAADFGPYDRPGMHSFQEDLTGRFGVGLILGEPSGVSLKYFFTDTLAVDGGVGWAFHRETDLHLHADVLWHKFDLISVPEGRLPIYFGVGPRLKAMDKGDDRFGVRAPVGVSYLFETLPLDVFVEVAPVLDVAPGVRGSLTAGIGARWWF